jgi:DNA-binding MarR family transcriptional regulator
MSTKQIAAQLDGIARDCIAVRLRLVNRVITGVYDESLRPLGLKVSQMNILVVAAKLGVARPAEVCRILQMDTSTLSRNVERMRAKGWLETVVDAQDARAQPFRVTAAGRKLLERVVPVWKRAQKKAAGMLGTEGVAMLGRVAGTLGLSKKQST